MNSEFFDALRLLSKEKGLKMEALCDGIQKAIITAVKKDYDNKEDMVFCEINHEKKDMKVYIRKNVVSEISDPVSDILVDHAQKYKTGALPGEIIEIPLETKDVSRIAADKGKHVLRQGIREAEHGQLREEFQSRIQEIITVKVQRIDPITGDATIEIGKLEETLPKSEQMPHETFKEGDIIKVFVVDVKDLDRKFPKATLSRTHSGLVKRLFETEVPEIYDGTVEIRAISREAGSRTKMAVYSSDENVDPVGACIGPRGARVGKIVDMLGGEKIDIVRFSEDQAEFISEALKPADVIAVDINEGDERSCSVTVPDTQLSLAIGNKGQNARLAAKLTGWKIDIRPESGITEQTINFDEIT
ncbi:MAG: transcription termination/antitermination protein NusA [Clostridiales bacterium]|jgi:N utilization substance protein A|nr:transcription termination/antitermination protein NusA [Clostridiales bacterium]